jgi:hypothetical protein
MSKVVHVKLIYKRYFIATKNISGKQLHEIDLAIKEKNENNIKLNRVLTRITKLIINNPHNKFKIGRPFKTFFGIRYIIT